MNTSSPDEGGLKSTRTPERTARRAQVPRRYRALYRRSQTGRSRKASIRCFCLECMGWSEAEVPSCTDSVCPLYLFRMEG